MYQLAPPHHPALSIYVTEMSLDSVIYIHPALAVFLSVSLRYPIFVCTVVQKDEM